LGNRATSFFFLPLSKPLDTCRCRSPSPSFQTLLANTLVLPPPLWGRGQNSPGSLFFPPGTKGRSRSPRFVGVPKTKALRPRASSHFPCNAGSYPKKKTSLRVPFLFFSPLKPDPSCLLRSPLVPFSSLFSIWTLDRRTESNRLLPSQHNLNFSGFYLFFFLKKEILRPIFNGLCPPPFFFLFRNQLRPFCCNEPPPFPPVSRMRPFSNNADSV